MPDKKAFNQLCSEWKLDETGNGMAKAMPFPAKSNITFLCPRLFPAGAFVGCRVGGKCSLELGAAEGTLVLPASHPLAAPGAAPEDHMEYNGA